jgi:putative nucleotidyltransferase with HDIG domain
VITIPDVSLSADFAETGLISDEEFQSCVVLPLIAQGRTYGVLEVYRRRPLSQAEDWITFLQAVATQTAIAIDNAELIENLSQSNRNLTIAYDRTLEGWSRALEMRDDETNGHSQRVTELAVQLALRFGITGEELDNLRRGALLHDIGKMAIPDSILLKRGPLTHSEREIMRRHPIYGFELLSKIPFLEGALDIPYAHHEKWDGSGYPRGLAGNEIPLAARIFSIIDVWDALTTDRPYRAAWQPEAARQYIRAQAGHHFDPLVVQEFLALNLPGPASTRPQIGMRKL